MGGDVIYFILDRDGREDRVLSPGSFQAKLGQDYHSILGLAVLGVAKCQDRAFFLFQEEKSSLSCFPLLLAGNTSPEIAGAILYSLCPS